MDTTLLSLLLPEGILEYFELTNVIKKEDSYYLFLSERNPPPQEYQSDQLQSKGYFDEETVRDFPLRGKACYLKIKRRKWLNLTTGKTVYRDWEMVADGYTDDEGVFRFFKRTWWIKHPSVVRH